ncbi:MAG: hypothetical protein HND58_02680 [Planctomycetota bacterium]|nr:MAG: hypothetical protein HND58_02680 [Planctomycetota bacterium]
MWKSGVLVLAAAAVLFVTGVGSTGAQPTPAREPAFRVGTYDNRAIAIAWVRSEFSDLGELREQLDAAETAGDQAKIDELMELGPKVQQKLHLQGFGRAPVSDLLEAVQDRLTEVAEETGVDVIVFECNFAGPGVEVVDVTDALVELFSPTVETRTTIDALLRNDPVPLEDLHPEH